MKKNLTRKELKLFHFENKKRIEGKNKQMGGDCSELRGDCSGLSGNCSGLSGDLDDCKITEEEIKKGIDTQTNAPYTCIRCNNKSGWSWIEPHHDCNNPMFDEKGNINKNYKEKVSQKKINMQHIPIL